MKPRKITPKTIFIDVITIANGKDGCYAKINGWIAYFIGSGFEIYNTIVNKLPFDFKSYCEGTAILIGGVGAAIYMKKKDEPSNSDQTQDQ